MANTKTPSRQARRDVAAEITQRIIDELDKGVMPWRCNWRRAGGSLPRRHSGEPYRGINLLILALTAHAGGYSSPYWMTYKQAVRRASRMKGVVTMT